MSEIISVLTAFAGFYAAFSWQLYSEMFFMCMAVTLLSILEHTVSILVHTGLVINHISFWFLWLDRLMAWISVYMRWKYIDNKLEFFKKKIFVCSCILIILLDSGQVPHNLYHYVHGIWHICAFMLLHKEI